MKTETAITLGAYMPHKPHRPHTLTAALALVAALLLATACTDELLPTAAGRPAEADADGMAFSISTVEMNDRTVDLTRSSASEADVRRYREASHYAAHALQGDNPWGLKVWRMPLPLMEIHPHTASARSTLPLQATADTRSPSSEIATTESFHDSLTIWGYTDQRELLKQKLLKRIRNWRSSVHWPYDNDYEERSQTMRFYAVAPAMESLNLSVTNSSGINISTPPQFTYTLPETTGEMRDLLFGESPLIDVQTGPKGTTAGNPKGENLGQDNKLIPLRFEHILTAVRFTTGSMPEGVTLKQITVHNVNTRAHFDPTATDAATGTLGAWSTPTAPASYTLWPETSPSGSYLTDSVLFMIPHTLTEDTELQIVIEAAPHNQTTFGTEVKRHPLTCSLKGDVWKKGYSVCYNITVGKVEDGYYFVVDAENGIEAPHEGGSGTFSVHSYHSYWDYASGVEDKTVAVNWTRDGYYSDETATAPTELTLDDDWSTKYKCTKWLTVGGADAGSSKFVGGDNSEATYSYDPQSAKNSGNHETKLKPTKDPIDGYDLSSDGYANCYIVREPGTNYTFPLVYGNGTITTGLPDHTGTEISETWIKDQLEAKNPSDYTEDDPTHRHKDVYKWDAHDLKAELLWQDVEGLISSVTVMPDNRKVGSTGNGMISFTISQANIKPGNAVIALKARKVRMSSTKTGESWSTDTRTLIGDGDNWETVWAWHIWATDEATAAKTLGSTDILPVNLGWVPDQMNYDTYEKRQVWVKLKQDQSGEERVVCFTQHARQPLVTGTSPVYQWGRPTPLPAVCYADGSPRPVYDIDGNMINDQFTVENNISGSAATAITHPTKLLKLTTDDKCWTDATDLWSASTKTAYDPCPAGYQVPAYGAFTAMSRTGVTASLGTSLNIWHDAAEQGKGAWFYCEEHSAWTDEATDDSYRYKPAIYFPATGRYQTESVMSGTPMGNGEAPVFVDNSAGLLWTGTSGEAIRFVPDWKWTGPGNAIDLPLSPVPASTAMPLRPKKTTP